MTWSVLGHVLMEIIGPVQPHPNVLSRVDRKQVARDCIAGWLVLEFPVPGFGGIE